MQQASIYKLETRDVWQILLLTIPDELRPKMTEDLKTGNIAVRQHGETEADVFDRIRLNLLDMRGPQRVEWNKIIDVKQTNETFESFAERMWAVFREHGGIPDCTRDNVILLDMLRSNAGPHILNALAMGGDPPEDTFRSLVTWATKIEDRSKIHKSQPVAATQWVAEGKGVVPTKRCNYCGKLGHSQEDCWNIRRQPRSPKQNRRSPKQNRRSPKQNRHSPKQHRDSPKQYKENMHNFNTPRPDFKPETPKSIYSPAIDKLHQTITQNYDE